MERNGDNIWEMIADSHGDTGFLERTYCHPQMQLKQKAANQFTQRVFFGGGVTNTATA